MATVKPLLTAEQARPLAVSRHPEALGPDLSLGESTLQETAANPIVLTNMLNERHKDRHYFVMDDNIYVTTPEIGEQFAKAEKESGTAFRKSAEGAVQNLDAVPVDRSMVSKLAASVFPTLGASVGGMLGGAAGLMTGGPAGALALASAGAGAGGAAGEGLNQFIAHKVLSTYEGGKGADGDSRIPTSIDKGKIATNFVLSALGEPAARIGAAGLRAVPIVNRASESLGETLMPRSDMVGKFGTADIDAARILQGNPGQQMSEITKINTPIRGALKGAEEALALNPIPLQKKLEENIATRIAKNPAQSLDAVETEELQKIIDNLKTSKSFKKISDEALKEKIATPQFYKQQLENLSGEFQPRGMREPNPTTGHPGDIGLDIQDINKLGPKALKYLSRLSGSKTNLGILPEEAMASLKNVAGDLGTLQANLNAQKVFEKEALGKNAPWSAPLYAAERGSRAITRPITAGTAAEYSRGNTSQEAYQNQLNKTTLDQLKTRLSPDQFKAILDAISGTAGSK